MAGHAAAVVAGVGLLLLAHQLRRGKRRAWAVAIVLFAVAAASALLRGPDPVAVVAATAMVVALAWHRDAFRAQPDPTSLLSVARFAVTYLGAVLGFGVLTLVLEAEHVRQPLSAGGAVEATVAGLAGLDGPYDYTGRFFAEFFPAALLGLGIAGLAALSWLAFRVVRDDGTTSAADRERARALVHAHGSDTLDYFALRPDKSYFFTAAGDAMVAYAYLGGHALVSADPIGPPGAKARAIDEFVAFCRERGWHPAFLAVREDDLPVYRRHGLRSLYLGDEAVIRCDRFSLSGSAMKSVRAAVRRVGAQCEFRLLPEAEASPQLRAQLEQVRERWRGDEAERGFTMELGGGVDGENPDLLLAVATGPDGRPLGFLRLVPCYGADPGWSLDLMQHDPDAPNGMTEFLIAETAQALARRGVPAAVAELRRLGPPVRPGHAARPDPARAATGRARAQPVLPDRLAARLQREVRPRVGAALHRRGGRRGDPEGRAALRERRGVRRTARDRLAARARGPRRAGGGMSVATAARPDRLQRIRARPIATASGSTGAPSGPGA